MLTRVCLGLALLSAIDGWSQAVPAATGAAPAQNDDTPMQTPPPVSGEPYPTVVGAETRSNYLRTAVNVNTAYDDNVLTGTNGKPVADATFSFYPTIALDQTTPRLRQTLTYSPGFTFYQPTSALNEVDQNASANFQYRMSEHSTVVVRDNLQRSSNAFNQTESAVSGSSQAPPPTVIAPYGDRLTNALSAELSYQYSRNSMIGGGGSLSELDYPNPSQVPGLYNSSSRGGAAFWSKRLTPTEYFGTAYQYSQSLASPAHVQSETETHSIGVFFTIYLKRTFSMSLVGGAEHSTFSQSSMASAGSWNPEVTASVGWQRSHTNLAASYMRVVSGEGGLLGAFEANTGNALLRWQTGRTWNVGASGSYASNKNITPVAFSSSTGGRSISGSGSIQHTVSEHIGAECGYQRLHQSYPGVLVLANNPDSDRFYVTLSYQFTRPLGR